MPRKPRTLRPGYAYHLTTRCNNREFRLSRRECREVLLYALKRALDKYNFKLYALCIMCNRVHYLLEPTHPDELPTILHFLNWYTAMWFNRMLNHTGHFWEKRYFSEGFPPEAQQRALNTLRYIHGNPKAARMRSSFFYDFSNYGSYERLTDDGLTEWHPAFLKLGNSLEACAQRYRSFCRQYQPKPHPPRRCPWGSRLLAGGKGSCTRTRADDAQPPAHTAHPFAPATDRCQVTEASVVEEVVEQFIAANRPPQAAERAV